VTIKTIMWNYNGIIRTVKRMERAKADLEYLKRRIEKFYQQSEIGNRIITLRDSVQAALLIVEAALRNRVSRGAHFIKADEN
jgi:L-aspartate oxidase